MKLQEFISYEVLINSSHQIDCAATTTRSSKAKTFRGNFRVSVDSQRVGKAPRRKNSFELTLA